MSTTIRTTTRIHPITGEVRHYLNRGDIAAALQLDVAYYKSGSVTSATLAGEDISSRQADRLLWTIYDMRCWLDDDGTLHYDVNYADQRVLDAIRSTLA